jgi:DUF4097 and DUF4098 domain-containing protein YvlB
MRTETFQTPGPVRADVRIGSGEIRFETVDTAETTVTLEPLRDNDATQRAVEEARIELREYGGRYEVLVEVRDHGGRSFGLGRGADVRVELRCPEETEIETRTGSADVEGRGRYGSVDVETGSGDVHFDEVTGDTRISAASGDVDVERIGGEARINTASGDVQLSTVSGAAKINSASGDVTLRQAGDSVDVNSASGDVFVGEVASSVTVSTASGDQQIERAGQGKVTLKSASGDLEIGIPEGSTLWVDARSRSGEVRSELPVSETAPEGEGPHIELRANTMSGDISVTRA